MSKLKTSSDGPEANAIDNDDDDDRESTKSDLKGDWANFFLLLLLYIMQGLPLGISNTIPILIQSKDVTYSDQAKFSLSGYPFSLKILWAPIIDALYVQKFGRRKTWLVPIQYLIGIILIFLAWDIDNLLPDNGKPDIISLLFVFLSTSFLAATQDIAVDGWSLTMLKKKNVGYASICNSSGQAIGKLLGSMPLILLTSENFCNTYLRITPVLGNGGIVTMKTLIYGWGILFITITTLIAILKREKDCTSEESHVKVNVLQSYSLLWYILKLPSIQLLAIILVTVKIGFIPANGDIVSLKLIDAGISKDMITVINSTLFILNIFVPIAIAKLISGKKAMSVFLQITIFRLPMNVAFALLIYYTYQLGISNENVQIPTYYYSILVVTCLVQSAIAYTMFVAAQSFFSQISDARFGGTYMTLLNTLLNFGNKWTSTASLALLDLLTSKVGSNDSTDTSCKTDLQNKCGENLGKFVMHVDGYYIEGVLCTSIGIVWYFIFRKKVKKLQTINSSNWLVNVKNPRTDKAKPYSVTEMSKV